MHVSYACELAWGLAATLLAAAVYLSTDGNVTAFALCGIPLGLIVCLKYPLQICTVFVAFSFFRLHEAYPFLSPYKIPLALGMLMFVASVLHLFVVKTIHPFMTTELKRLAALFAIILVGVIFAQDRNVAWDYMYNVYWKIMLMTFVIAWLAHSDADYKFIARTLILSGALVAAVVIYNKIYGISLVEGTRVAIGRLPEALNPEDAEKNALTNSLSVLADPNDLSLVLLFPLAFAVSMIIYRNSKFDTLLGIVSASAIALAIVFTQSRGGLFGVMAVLGIIGAHRIRSRGLLISLVVIGTLGLGAAMNLKGRVSGGEAELAQTSIDDSSLGRIQAWGTAINMAKRRPLTGVGINNFQGSYVLYTDYWLRVNKAVHSTWFQVLGETGIPGLVTFILLVTATIRSAMRNLRDLVAANAPPIFTATALSLVAGLAGFCAAGTFLTQAFSWPLYVLIGLTAAVTRAVQTLDSHPNARPANGPAAIMPAPLIKPRPTMIGLMAGH